jgi:hypothetical protein
MSSLESRCYLIYGSKFKPLMVKGFSNRSKVVNLLRTKGLKPNTSLLHSDSENSKNCKTTPTLYITSQ